MDTKQVYNDNAQKWLRLSPSSLSDFTARPIVFERCGPLAGQSILDIGCGEGYCARELKSRGAGRCVGIDLSENMINAAQQREQQSPLGIEYYVGNVVGFSLPQRFDICIAVFLFNYLKVQEMQTVMAKVYGALEPGGKFIFTVPHPLFPFVVKEQAPPFYFSAAGKNYFDDVDQQLEGEIWKQNGEALHVQCVHKTFESYFHCLAQAGFTRLPRITELTVTPQLVDTNPDFFSPLLNQPLHVLFEVEK